MRILEEFWYGNIEPTEYDTISCKEYKEVNGLTDKRFAFGTRNIFVPISEFIIQGLEEEIGVEFNNNLYFASNNEVSSYIVRTLEKLGSEKTTKHLINRFLQFVTFSCIFTGVIANNNQLTALVQHKFSADDEEELWKVVDRTEFFNVALKKRHSLYSTTNWSRRNPKLNENFLLQTLMS